ncbi:tRNA pseudouridine13 synthase [Entomortierella parvispora]|uniref:tRNA pseudouridine13 synthase n=1 Tax=Entomortierella parvispora TaxID=205924 RepID=A0A9P3LTK4_9FUNG|nr:tRNA pseudouridine13 synthase [Entomortierella parvispora]
MASEMSPDTVVSETLVGITTFVDPSIPGFSAIIKQRYSDFIVNEVDQDNQVVHLTSFDLPELDPEALKARDDKIQAKDDLEQANSEMDEAAKLAELAAVLDNDEETMAQIKKMLDSYGNDLEFVNLKPQADKAKRTAIHRVVKERYNRRMVSETSDGTMRLRMHQKKDDRDTRGKGKTDHWSVTGGEFCRFCLFKENRETMEALTHIATMLRVPNKVFSIAGTKDRRGVTTQWVTGHKVKAERLITLNNGLRNMCVGNFSYVKKGLKLGDLNGNRFMITLRNVIVDSEETLNRSMVSLRDKGFMNYFGMQRFGTGSVGTHDVGRALLRGEWAEAVHLILKPRLGEGPDITKARQHWAEHKDAAAACKMFPRRWVAESQILYSFQKAGSTSAPMDALNSIPRNLRLMYVHAYQSLVWNNMVTERVRLYGSDKPVVGDLVVENKAALDKADEESEGAGNGNIKGEVVRAKVLTAEDVDNYSIYDVILPLPGYDVIYPKHAIGDLYKEFMAKDGLNPHAMRRPQKEYALVGSYRCILSKPENVEWEVVRYNDAEIPLTLTDQEKMQGKTKPDGVGETGQYLALVLNLTLKSSQYATMAIREVCKQDTSAAFQASLNTTKSEANSSATTPAASTPATPATSSETDAKEDGAAKRGIESVEDATPAPEAKVVKE